MHSACAVVLAGIMMHSACAVVLAGIMKHSACAVVLAGVTISVYLEMLKKCN